VESGHWYNYELSWPAQPWHGWMDVDERTASLFLRLGPQLDDSVQQSYVDEGDEEERATRIVRHEGDEFDWRLEVYVRRGCNPSVEEFDLHWTIQFAGPTDEEIISLIEDCSTLGEADTWYFLIACIDEDDDEVDEEEEGGGGEKRRSNQKRHDMCPFRIRADSTHPFLSRLVY
jgi:hypothetical protein